MPIPRPFAIGLTRIGWFRLPFPSLPPSSPTPVPATLYEGSMPVQPREQPNRVASGGVFIDAMQADELARLRSPRFRTATEADFLDPMFPISYWGSMFPTGQPITV